MLTTTTQDVPGMVVVEIVDVVVGNTVRSRHFGRDLMAGLKGMAGGEIFQYTEMMSEARTEAFGRMIAAAQKLGADAVIGVRFETCEIGQMQCEMLAYGTAVKLAVKLTPAQPSNV